MMESSPRAAVVYLDWNLMQDLIDGRFPSFKRNLSDLQARGAILVPFTHEHIREAIFGLSPEEPRYLEVLTGIDTVSGGLLLRAGQPAPFDLAAAKEIADDIAEEANTLRRLGTHHAEQMDAFRTTCSTILTQLDATDQERSKFFARFDRILNGESEGLGVLALTAILNELLWNQRSALDARTGGPSRLNNGSAEGALHALDAIAGVTDGPTASSQIRATAVSDRVGRVAGINAALNVTGWWRDKDVSHRSIMLDGMHLNHAFMHADLFFTLDRKLHRRGCAVAEMCEVPVQVVLFADGITLALPD